MRKDMSKVVTERPREGHYLASRKTRLRIRRYDPEKVYDDLPLRVSGSRNKHLVNARKQTRSRYDEVKHFSDLIGPLQRFLRSNVGRPWDDVYSEMKRSLDSRKVTGQHIFDHVKWEVELHPVIGEDGKIYESYPHCRKRRLLQGLYVDPRTGLLCRADREEFTPPPEITYIPHTEFSGNLKIDGIWHFISFKAKSGDGMKWMFDRVKGHWVLAETPASRLITLPNGKEAVIVVKEPLTRQERKAAGLRNDR